MADCLWCFRVPIFFFTEYTQLLCPQKKIVKLAGTMTKIPEQNIIIKAPQVLSLVILLSLVENVCLQEIIKRNFEALHVGDQISFSIQQHIHVRKKFQCFLQCSLQDSCVALQLDGFVCSMFSQIQSFQNVVSMIVFDPSMKIWIKKAIPKASACLSPFLQEGQHCFLLITVAQTWDDAKSNCSGYEGEVQLAELDSQNVSFFKF